MSIGIPPRAEVIYEQQYPQGQVMGRCLLVLARLGWKLIPQDNDSFRAVIGQVETNQFHMFRLWYSHGTLKLRVDLGSGAFWDNNSCSEYLTRFCADFQTPITDEELTDALLAYESYLDELQAMLEQERIEYEKLERDARERGPQPFWKEFLGFFTPQEAYFFSPIIMGLNILVFVVLSFMGVSVLDPQADLLLKYGGNFRPAILEGEWWRLFTSTFMHAGIIHLAMNLFAFFMVGPQLELFLGKWRFLLAYVFCGIMASLSSTWFHSMTVGVGASGAIFGLYGIFLGLLSTRLIDPSMRKRMLSGIGAFVFYNLLFGLSPGIDNSAHTGGLISGFILGLLFFFYLRFPYNRFYKWALPLLVAIPFLLFGFKTVAALPEVLSLYDKKSEAFSKQEEQVLQYMNKMSQLSQDEGLLLLQNKIIPGWERCVRLNEEIQELDLEHRLKEREELVGMYCKTRLALAKETYKQGGGKKSRQNQLIDFYSNRADSLLKIIQEY
ncbi:MAG: rhomboid family intramembrane serine protease [Bacteroidetes bacterium]|nr:rhomboid family intramembrane serine protease [Bacteroidota bacterium]